MDGGYDMNWDKFRAATAEQGKYQTDVMQWMRACFPEAIWNSRRERNCRFFEEATELVQANNFDREMAHRIVDYVYDRDVGDLYQEVGGVMVTLAALCHVAGLDLQNCGDIELARIWTKVEKIREKQKQKPKDIAV